MSKPLSRLFVKLTKTLATAVFIFSTLSAGCEFCKSTQINPLSPWAHKSNHHELCQTCLSLILVEKQNTLAFGCPACPKESACTKRISFDLFKHLAVFPPEEGTPLKFTILWRALHSLSGWATETRLEKYHDWSPDKRWIVMDFQKLDELKALPTVAATMKAAAEEEIASIRAKLTAIDPSDEDAQEKRLATLEELKQPAFRMINPETAFPPVKAIIVREAVFSYQLAELFETLFTHFPNIVFIAQIDGHWTSVDSDSINVNGTPLCKDLLELLWPENPAPAEPPAFCTGLAPSRCSGPSPAQIKARFKGPSSSSSSSSSSSNSKSFESFPGLGPWQPAPTAVLECQMEEGCLSCGS